jgi:hypothetical protein
VEVIEMGEAAGISATALEMAELWVISNLLAEDVDARIPEDRWREAMNSLFRPGNNVVAAIGTSAGTENTSAAMPRNTDTSTAGATNLIVTNSGTTNTGPNTAAAINSAVDIRERVVSPPPGTLSQKKCISCFSN